MSRSRLRLFFFPAVLGLRMKWNTLKYRFLFTLQKNYIFQVMLWICLCVNIFEITTYIHMKRRKFSKATYASKQNKQDETRMTYMHVVCISHSYINTTHTHDTHIAKQCASFTCFSVSFSDIIFKERDRKYCK